VLPATRRRGRLGPLRPEVEDLLGAGAVVAALVAAGGRDPAGLAPEARSARAVFEAAGPDLAAWLADCASGRELAGLGWSDDVATAAVLDADTAVPVLDGVAFRAQRTP
jgi:2-phosphosulfolactate phosphatase